MIYAFNLITSNLYSDKRLLMIVVVILLAVVAMPVYGIYRLIIWKMTDNKG